MNWPMNATRNPILCAIDLADPNQAKTLVRTLKGAVGGIKLGLEFFTANGPRAVKAAASLEPLLLTVHCAGGAAMMKAASEAAKQAGRGKPMKLLGVTVLTSLDERDLEATGQKGPVAEQVKRLALLAKESGLDGIVCSPQEVAELRQALGPEFLLVVPGIRIGSLSHGDQKRVMGPKDAMASGADYLVIGRPITGSPSPAAAARSMLAEIGPEIRRS